jgi:mannose-6-phosphate isomerase-like protein (cupin superfamily)
MPVFKEKDTLPEIVSDRFRRRVSYLDKLMIVVCDFSGGPSPEPDPPHSHPHEQITYVAEGELYFFVGDEKHLLRKGDVYTVPSGIPHCIQIISGHVRLIDSFSPIREEFIKSSQ